MCRTIIIAEAGVNHNGSFEVAKKLIDIAVDAGVDYVKFQTFKTHAVVSKIAKKADYQKKNTGSADDSQIDMIKKLELSEEDHIKLFNYARDRKIKFLSTAFDLESIDFLASLNLGLWKIPSGEVTNYPYLKKIGCRNEPVILSTGMCNIQEIEAAIRVLTNSGTSYDNISLLHCTTEYPAPMNEINLKVIETLKKHFKLNVGYSDHTLEIEVPIAAVALGASIIEKHFTLDKTMEGPDHKASLEPDELKSMVTAIRNIEKALGSGEKEVAVSESKNMVIARKSIVALRNIRKGDLYTEENITVKRPGNGISPMRWDEIIGKNAIRDFEEDELIEL